MKVVLLTFASVLFSCAAQAATSIDIQVADTLAPPACNVTLGNHGLVDYGTIHITRLNNDANAYSVLDEKRLSLNIQCESATRVAIKGTSNRRGTLAGAAEGALNGSGFAPVKLFGLQRAAATGLGSVNGRKTGGFGMRLVPGSATADGKAVAPFYRHAHIPGTWNFSDEGLILYPADDIQTSWSLIHDGNPLPFSVLSAELAVQAYINKKSELDLSQSFMLDGSVTLELIYL